LQHPASSDEGFGGSNVQPPCHAFLEGLVRVSSYFRAWDSEE
jgi:hypothetical protein